MTSRVPTGTELARPFLPAKDFDLSKHFYESLGFEKTPDDEVALVKAGSGGCARRVGLNNVRHRDVRQRTVWELLDELPVRCSTTPIRESPT